ncbi:MAG: response regulator [Deltaproteobacteria bacterium]|nr:response regulator [Deltaproteobacteria bacterium]
MSRATAKLRDSRPRSLNLHPDSGIFPLRRVLLVVDDDESVCKGLVRLLGNRFEETVTALNPGEAVSMLDTRLVTHIVCDYWLGQGQPLGIDLVATWRKKYSSIQHAVIFTGNDINAIPTTVGVDDIISKSAKPSALIEKLI